MYLHLFSVDFIEIFYTTMRFALVIFHLPPDAFLALKEKCLIFVIIIAYWKNYGRENDFCSKFCGMNNSNFICTSMLLLFR